MMDKNPQALAMAFKKCAGKLAKIKELGISSDMDPESIEVLIENLATAKALEDNSKLADHVKGQRWYVEQLVKFSGLSIEDQMATEYTASFADTASEDEMLDALRAMAA